MWLNVGMDPGKVETPPTTRCEDADAVAAEVVADGVAKTVAAGYFRRGMASFVGGDVDAIFDLASLTKPMTAVAFFKAKLSPEAPLGWFLPELRGTSAGEVPIELFFAHRSGVPAHLSLFAPLLEGRTVDAADALMIAALSRAELPDGHDEHAPVYSDTGYILAGVALARAVGARDAGEAIEELVSRPLGLHHVLGTARGLRSRADFDARVVPTEVVAFRGGEVRGAVHDENAWALTGSGGSGHAGMFGTLGAVLAFAHHTLDLGEDAEWLFRPRKSGSQLAGFDGKSSEGSSAGEVLGHRTYGHLGFTGTSFWVDPALGIGVSLLTNRVHPTRENPRIRVARPRAHDALARLALSKTR